MNKVITINKDRNNVKRIKKGNIIKFKPVRLINRRNKKNENR